jgi:hypothetical protein
LITKLTKDSFSSDSFLVLNIMLSLFWDLFKERMAGRVGAGRREAHDTILPGKGITPAFFLFEKNVV